jgi:hypothetical protein
MRMRRFSEEQIVQVLEEAGFRFRRHSQLWQNPGVAVPFRAQLPPQDCQS